MARSVDQPESKGSRTDSGQKFIESSRNNWDNARRACRSTKLQVAMLGKPFLIASLTLAGILGSVLGAWDLNRAITLCQSLYSTDIMSLQVENDLADDLEAGRRTLLTALVSTDGKRQSKCIWISSVLVVNMKHDRTSMCNRDSALPEPE
jgi:hypothetical protein